MNKHLVYTVISSSDLNVNKKEEEQVYLALREFWADSEYGNDVYYADFECQIGDYEGYFSMFESDLNKARESFLEYYTQEELTLVEYVVKVKAPNTGVLYHFWW